MLPRTLEPEVMDSEAEAADYDAMDHSEVNRRFVDDFLALKPTSQEMRPLTVLDVGTGTALIPIELCGRGIAAMVTGADLAAHMLAYARRNVARAGLEHAIQLDHVDAKQLPYSIATFDAVISNSIVHHIPRPFDALREMVRILRPGGLLFVRDLFRPSDDVAVAMIVETYAAGANDHQRKMFRDSLYAALTLDEIRQLAVELELSEASVTQTSDRHWTLAVRLDP